jgi:hypothetical protein
MAYLRPVSLVFTLTLVAACTPLDVGPVTESSSTTNGSSGSTTTEPTGTTSPTTSASGTTEEGPTTAAETGSSSTTEGSLSDSDSEEWGPTGGDCDVTCGEHIECVHPDVPDSAGAEPCLEGFHCENASACGCSLTFCHENCDPDDRGSCPGEKVCDADSGECVDPRARL